MKRKDFIRKSFLISGGIAVSPVFSLWAREKENLKKVVLIGDSIRIGYQPYVIENLKGFAQIWVPDENGRTTDNIIYNLNNWVRKQNPDILHINAGLHDIRTLSWELGPGNTIVSPRHYMKNLETIFSWIQEYVNCKVIWATTTPVIDEYVKAGHKRAGDFTRYDEDVQKFNKIASRVAKRFDVPVNDLYTYVKEEIGMQEIKKDGVHFTDTGYKLLGERVAEIILKV
jgi:lysophospholipase L1-like esterase